MALVLDLESNAESLTMPRMSTVDRSRSSEIGIDDDVSGPIVLDLERQYGQALFGFVRRLGLSDAQASDAVQDVMLRLWIELRAGRAIEQPKAWAFRTIYRLAMDQHRLQRRIEGVAERLGRARAWHDSDARDISERVAVWAEVARLPGRQRHVLYLRFRADLSFEQIGSVMGITPSAARSHATQAMATLRRRLGDDAEGVRR